ncbi:MAG: glycosyl hydrolase, partial [Bacteroidetes bacterium HGW-Bacteroidetes-15]
YRVVPGDSLWKISQRYNTTVNQLKAANNLTGDRILVGQVLNIPGSSNVTHTVQRGDTLWLIAQRYNTTADNIINQNRLPSTIIYPGQTLIIAGNSSSPSTPPAQNNNTLTTQGTVYTVRSGDTLSSLAGRFNTSVQAIMQTNRLNSQLLMIGQILVIPQNSLKPVDMQVPSRQRIGHFGEYLEWPYASMLFNVGATATITDLASGLNFRVKRLGGGNHADTEPLTAADTAVMKRIYGGVWSWRTRHIIVEIAGRYIAASMNGMPHSIQTIYNNNFPGHFCIHFLNSRNHNTNSIDPSHQASVRRAAGM